MHLKAPTQILGKGTPDAIDLQSAGTAVGAADATGCCVLVHTTPHCAALHEP